MTQHHDPVHPDSPHLTWELLADLDEGLLDEASAAHAQHHLAHCPPCRDRQAELAEVTASLRDLPVAPMPAERAAQLDAFLASLTDPALMSATDATNLAAPVVDLAEARQRRSGWASRWATAAASVAAVMLVSAVGLSMMAGGSDDGDLTALAEADGQAPDDANAFQVSPMGAEYTQQGLTEQVDILLVSHDTPATPESTTSPTPTATPRMASQPAVPETAATVTADTLAYRTTLLDPATLQACVVDYLLYPESEPLAVDLGTFEGQPAAIIVMPSENAEGAAIMEAAVFVVDPMCSGPDATLLHYALVTLDPPVTLSAAP